MEKSFKLPDYFGEFIWWMGVVEDRNDPLFLGRCRVRILGYHGHDKNIPHTGVYTNDLPWAYPMQPITSSAMNGIGTTPTGPVEGTWVVGFFRDGKEAQQPIMMGTMGGIPQDSTWEALDNYEMEKGFHDPRTEKEAEAGNKDNKGTQNLKTAPIRVTDYKITSTSAKVKGPHYQSTKSDDYIVEEENSTNYPRVDGKTYYAQTKEADTNRLAHPDSEKKTIVDLKKANVQKANQTAYSDHESQTEIAGSGSVTKREKVDGKGRDLTCASSSTPENRCHDTTDSDVAQTVVSQTDLQVPNDGKDIFPHKSGTLASSAIESKTGYDWDEPETPYNAVYPYNHVYESESGHYHEYDDTKGSERIHQYHRSGTFEEIHPDGTVVQKIVGTNYTIYCEDDNVRIAGDANITVDRGMKLLINNAQYERAKLGTDDICENDLDIEIAQGSNININVNRGNINCKINEGDINTYLEKGNVYTTLDLGHISNTILEGDSHTQVKKGNVNLRVDEGHIETVLKKGDVKFHQGTGSTKIEIDTGNLIARVHTGNISTKVDTGDMYSEITTGNMYTEIVNGHMTSQLGSGNMSATVNGDIYFDATGDTGIHSFGSIDLFSSSGDINIEAVGNVQVTGASIYFNTSGKKSSDAGLIDTHTSHKGEVEQPQFDTTLLSQTLFNNGSTTGEATLGVIE